MALCHSVVIRKRLEAASRLLSGLKGLTSWRRSQQQKPGFLSSGRTTNSKQETQLHYAAGLGPECSKGTESKARLEAVGLHE